MFQRIRKSYEHTIYASYIGYITQAIVNNFAPLLFLTFASEFALTLDKITVITTLNFLVQLLVDLLSAKAVDKIGYRASAVIAHFFAAVGLIGMAVLPTLLENAYAGILICVVCYAIGGGIIEVLISPIVEACPTKKKEAAMSLLHSFYCWGHVFVVLASTAFFHFIGIQSWRVLAVLWALIPLFNLFYFLLVPIYPIVEPGERVPVRNLLKQKAFWIFFVMMICAGASEQGMSQWVSTFAESALHVSKTVGDLLGTCLFAVLMGTSRALYGKFSEKIPLTKAMTFCSILCLGCYILAALVPNPYIGLLACGILGFSVGIFWPGTFSMSAASLPGGGTAMFAFLALAGDLGCSSGPTLVGMVSSTNGGNMTMGLLAAIVFPILMLASIVIQKRVCYAKK